MMYWTLFPICACHVWKWGLKHISVCNRVQHHQWDENHALSDQYNAVSINERIIKGKQKCSQSLIPDLNQEALLGVNSTWLLRPWEVFFH